MMLLDINFLQESAEVQVAHKLVLILLQTGHKSTIRGEDKHTQNPGFLALLETNLWLFLVNSSQKYNCH